MSIQISEIKEGYKYKTPNNQERIVLGVAGDSVTYASRGGNVKNKWEKQRNTSTLDRFADACDEVLEKISDDELEKVKKDNNY
jgi:hypothetical protein